MGYRFEYICLCDEADLRLASFHRVKVYMISSSTIEIYNLQIQKQVWHGPDI